MDRRAVIYVNLAVFLFGCAGLFARWIGLPALEITFGRVLFSSLALLTLLRLRRVPLGLSAGRDRGLFLLAGGILALHWWTFLGSIQLSSVAVGTITFSSFPLFVTFLEPLVFRVKLRRSSVVSAALILLGVLITVPLQSFQSRYALGIAVGMGSALSYAILTLLNKHFSRTYPGSLTAFYEQAVAAVILAVPVLIRGNVPTARDVGGLLLLGVLFTALAHTLFISSLKSIPARLAGVCSSMETVYGILLALLVLGEVPSVRECIGAAVILTVVIWSQLREAGAGESAKNAEG